MQDITRQHSELEKMGVLKENIFSEYESGTKIERVQLNKLLNIVDTGDSIICTEPSRITRSMPQLLNLLEFAKTKQIKMVFGSFVVDFTNNVDPMTLAVVELIGIFSALEVHLVSERIKSGIRHAKSLGRSVGRREVTINDIPDKFRKLYMVYRQGSIDKVTLAQLTNVSYPTCLKYCKMIENDN